MEPAAPVPTSQSGNPWGALPTDTPGQVPGAGNAARSNSPPPLLPTPSLPKGGGAIRGLGEKLSANPVTGAGSMTVPITVSPGRAGFGPQLELGYDSSAGNGPFGFGWSLRLPQITRKTEKGLPLYRDREEADVFILTGSEDLVPVLLPDGRRFADTVSAPGYTIHRYRPRLEGSFSRIERWTRDDGDVHWRSLTRDNLLTLYGLDASSRIADPEHPERVFAWLISETRDDRGNAVVYTYKREDGAGVPLEQAHQANRGTENDARRTANRYLKHIHYGNRVPLLDPDGRRPVFLTDAARQNAGWMFQVVFDYGEHGEPAPTPGDAGVWPYRDDPFSSYRPGFEVRTCRLCRRVLMFHQFPGDPEVGSNCLVRSTEFRYSREPEPELATRPVYSFLLTVTQSGYRRTGGGYRKRSFPPVEFQYTQPVIQQTVEEVGSDRLTNVPEGLAHPTYQWTDLYGEGLPGILSEQGGAWWYTRNKSPVPLRTEPERLEVHFAPLERVPVRPNLSLNGGQAAFMDLAGDGRPDLVQLEPPLLGFFESDGEEAWAPFRAFTSRPNLDLRDPNLRFVDLDGDGRADLLLTESDALVWHESLGEAGFGPARRLCGAPDEEKGPRLVFADGSQSIYLADLSGDGLSDLVRIRNGEVCYWPNLGYGRFGAKVAMDRSPHFDQPDQFDQRRIRLADLDGTGTTDLIYLHRDGVRLYLNQSGNRWSPAVPGPALDLFPRMDERASVAVVDLLGNGTACLVWSSPLPGDARRPLRYVELMGRQKPHLLRAVKNNLGAETEVEYAPSTRFYVEDRDAGRPWITHLPFPVHVVARVRTEDRISGSRFTTRYAYHHGHFDGEEREFRGFGLVEQWDTEEFAAFTREGGLPPSNGDPASHVPPVLTRTWYHTGLFAGRERVSRYFAGILDRRPGEYYREPGLSDEAALANLLDDTVLPPGLTANEEREACRALKGMMLRREVYALDGTGTPDHPFGHPYAVTEQNFTIQQLQAQGTNRHAVFRTSPREVLAYHYERNPADPRVSHTLTLETDVFGNVLRSVAIGYGRRQSPLSEQWDRDRQQTALLTYTENRFTHAIDDALKNPDGSSRYPRDYRTPLPAETRTYELIRFAPAAGERRFRFEEWVEEGFALLASAVEIPFEQAPDQQARRKRLIQRSCTRYRRDSLEGLLAIGVLEPLALPGESYRLALTPTLVAQHFRRQPPGQPEEPLLPAPGPLLEGKGEDQGGYVTIEGGWWVPSGRIFFDPAADVENPAVTAAQERETARQHFFLPRKAIDAFGSTSRVAYDASDLLPIQAADTLDNTVSVVNDYRVLQPRLLTDPNRNRSIVAFDTLGLVAATAVQGKDAEPDGLPKGDLLEGLDADPTGTAVQAFLADPRGQAAALLGQATSRMVYDVERYQRTGQPSVSAVLARERHFQDAGGPQSPVQVSLSYSDGFGREIQKKLQAEPGEAPQRRPNGVLPGGDLQPGELVRDAAGKPVLAHVQVRWVGSGRTVFNNKGLPVRQYEPFFSATPLYEPEREMTDTGVSPVLFYDPPGRVIAVLHPDHTYEKTEFDPWRKASYDRNDTVAAAGFQTGDPRTDPDIRGYVQRYFALQPAGWRTWHGLRAGGELGAVETDAAQKAAAHVDTPSVEHLDALGRTFLTVADNGPDPDQPGSRRLFATRVELDIAGIQRAVRDAVVQSGDALGRLVMRWEYDLLGNRLHQASMDGGERWLLPDAIGKPIRGWDSRGFAHRTTYDALRRPTGLFVTENGVERLAERTVYGEGQGDAANHRTHVYQLFDGAGVVTHVQYDFKGNLTEGRRALLPEYRQAVDWKQGPLANAGTFTTRTAYDALNRAVAVTTPDGSVYLAGFNAAGRLERVDVRLRGGAPTAFVRDIRYDAKGQRERIEYGCGAAAGQQGVTITYDYDPGTFRLIRMRSVRPAGLNGPASQLFTDPTLLQDLRYTYDPVGNITRIEDEALKTVLFNNAVVAPVCRYTYDPLYHLIEARGREHVDQNSLDFNPVDGNYRDFPFRGRRAQPADLQALRGYTEQYEYDPAGNLQALHHLANGGSWTRRYRYREASLLEPAKQGDRLTGTTLGNGQQHEETYTHDAHGNVVTMPHLAGMAWDFRDQLQQVDLGGGGKAYYVYDSRGQRVRKVIERVNGTRREERVYAGGYELYRQYAGDGHTPMLERESLHVMDGPERIALVEAQSIEDGSAILAPVPEPRYQLENHLGSAAVELDTAGNLISYEEYYPYGTSSFQAIGAGEASLKRYRYTGKERDEESGLYYHGARYYVPWLGRWTSCDPTWLTDGLNVYAFVHGNPVRLMDPNGREGTPGKQERSLWEQFKYEFFEGQFKVDEQNTPPMLKFDKFFEVGPARQAFLAHTFGAPFEEPTDPADREEWKRGEATAAVVVVADVVSGGMVPPGPNNLHPVPVTGPVTGNASFGAVSTPASLMRPPTLMATNKSEDEAQKKTTPAAPPEEPASGQAGQSPPESKPPEKQYTPNPPPRSETTPSKGTKTPNSQIEAERERFLASGGKVRVISEPTQEHHIATNKSSKYTAWLQVLFEGAGMDINTDPRNLVSIEGHKGAHGPDYHEIVLRRLTDAVRGLTPGTPEYRDAFTSELGRLKQDVARPGSPLNDLVTGKK